MAIGRRKYDGSTEGFTETECDFCDPADEERFLGGFVLKKGSLMKDILRSIIALGNIGMKGIFSEVARLVKAPLGNIQIQ